MFARMGYPEAALRQAQIVPVAAARMLCEIQCRLTTGHLAIELGRAGPGRGAACRDRRLSAPGDRVRGAGRSLEHPGLSGAVQPVSLAGEQRARPPRRRIDRAGASRSLACTRGCGARRRPRRQARCKGACRRDANAGPLVGPVRRDDGRGRRGVFRRRGLRIGRASGRGPGALSPGGAAAGDIAFWRKHVDAFQFAQGLCPGGRGTVGKARPGGRDGAADAVAQPGRDDSAEARASIRSTPWPSAGWRGLPQWPTA